MAGGSAGGARQHGRARTQRGRVGAAPAAAGHGKTLRVDARRESPERVRLLSAELDDDVQQCAVEDVQAMTGPSQLAVDFLVPENVLEERDTALYRTSKKILAQGYPHGVERGRGLSERLREHIIGHRS